MISKFFAKIFRGFGSTRNVSSPRKFVRRIAVEPLETRRLLSVTGSLSGFAYLDTHDFGVKDANEAGFAGLTVQLQSVNSQGKLSAVAGVGTVQTSADGAYSFTGLAAGAYQIQILPPSSVDVGVLSPGTAGGAAGHDEIQVTLSPGQNATDYNFAILGSQSDISLRMFLASAVDTTTTDNNSTNGATDNSPMTASATLMDPGDIAPAVTQQPSDVTIASGDTATFTATASGNPTPSVQWEVNIGDGNGFNNISDGTLGNGASYAGSSTGTLTITNVTTSMSGYQYEAVFTNGAGNATTNAASLTIQATTAPAVTQQPSDATIASGGTATFTATASGDPTPSVQWEVNIGDGNGFNNISDGTLGNGATYAGSSTGMLTITNAVASMSGYQYEAVFTSTAGNATTNAASLTVQAATAPAVTQQPSDATIASGGTATFTATASGDPTPSVQWAVNIGDGNGFNNISDGTLGNGATYAGSSTGTLTITNAAASMSGYQYEAVFTNGAGNATTDAASLTVQAATTAPAVTQQPSDAMIASGGTATFTATASGNPTPTVQWQVDIGNGNNYTALSDGDWATGPATRAAAPIR